MKIYLADGRVVSDTPWLNIELADGTRLSLREDTDGRLRISTLDFISITPLASNVITVTGR